MTQRSMEIKAVSSYIMVFQYNHRYVCMAQNQYEPEAEPCPCAPIRRMVC